MTLLAPKDALARAVAGIAAQGFAVVARNTRGDSVYLKPEGSAFALRVSNHARTPKQRVNHPDAVTSLVIRQPKIPITAVFNPNSTAFKKRAPRSGSSPNNPRRASKEG